MNQSKIEPPCSRTAVSKAPLATYTDEWKNTTSRHATPRQTSSDWYRGWGGVGGMRQTYFAFPLCALKVVGRRPAPCAVKRQRHTAPACGLLLSVAVRPFSQDNPHMSREQALQRV